jgi:flavin reductase (DIM6/NTAB) family NADH-FMN oxidoreductase RutF
LIIDIAAGERDWRSLYPLLLTTVTPRPIALVSSESADGQRNLAPFSWFNLVSANPPVLMFCPSVRRDGKDKDTFANIEAVREFVVALVTEAIAEPMARCATLLPPGSDEFEFSGLTPIGATQVKPPLVSDSPVNFECKLREVMSFGDEPGNGRVVLGDVVALHIADWLLDDDGLVVQERLRTVGRLGRDQYTTVQEAYSLRVPAPPEK